MLSRTYNRITQRCSRFYNGLSIEVNMTSHRFSALRSALTVSALLLVGPVAANWASQGERSVSFKAVGPGGLAIDGNGNDVSLKEQGDQFVATIGLNSLKTGIDLRDRHMKEKYLETPKYPQAVFTVDKSKVTVPGEGDAEGKLQLHGVTKAVKVHYKVAGSDKAATVSGSARINIKDFKVEVPSYLGVTVKPDVTISFKLDVANK
jgi:polyisoprenoid-binding protein YceI